MAPHELTSLLPLPNNSLPPVNHHCPTGAALPPVDPLVIADVDSHDDANKNALPMPAVVSPTKVANKPNRASTPCGRPPQNKDVEADGSSRKRKTRREGDEEADVPGETISPNDDEFDEDSPEHLCVKLFANTKLLAEAMKATDNDSENNGSAPDQMRKLLELRKQFDSALVTTVLRMVGKNGKYVAGGTIHNDNDIDAMEKLDSLADLQDLVFEDELPGRPKKKLSRRAQKSKPAKQPPPKKKQRIYKAKKTEKESLSVPPKSTEGPDATFALITNGMGHSEVTKNKMSFIESPCSQAYWTVALENYNFPAKFIGLVLSWTKKTSARHWQGDSISCCDFVSNFLEYASVPQMLSVMGWSWNEKGKWEDADNCGVAEYRKLRECFGASNHAGKMFQFRTLVVKLCKYMRDEKLDQRFVVKDAQAIISKTFKHFHTVHMEYMAVSETLLSLLPTSPDQNGNHMPDPMLWVKRLFSECKYEWQVHRGCHALFTLFQIGDGSIMKDDAEMKKLRRAILSYTTGKDPYYPGILMYCIRKAQKVQQSKVTLAYFAALVAKLHSVKNMISGRKPTKAEEETLYRSRAHHQYWMRKAYQHRRPACWPVKLTKGNITCRKLQEKVAEQLKEKEEANEEADASPAVQIRLDIPTIGEQRKKKTPAATSETALQPCQNGPVNDEQDASTTDPPAKAAASPSDPKEKEPSPASIEEMLVTEPVATEAIAKGYSAEAEREELKLGPDELNRIFGNGCRLATDDEVASNVRGPPHVYVQSDTETEGPKLLTMAMASQELYSFPDLGINPHGMQYIPIDERCAKICVDAKTSHVGKDFVVLRADNPRFDRLAECQLPIAGLAKFAVQYNQDLDMSEEAKARDHGGYRLEFGCAGQNFEKDARGRSIPSSYCNCDVFDDSIEEHKQIRQCLALILDAMQECMDDIDDHLETDRHFSCEARDKQFARVLRQMLGGRKFRNEWVTVQVKKLSRGDITKDHTDDSNCRWKGYDRTTSLCFVIVDADGQLWSVKIITNSRKTIGEYFEKASNSSHLVEHAKLYCDSVDESYVKYREEFEKKNHSVYPGLETPTWETPEKLMLSDASPYQQVELTDTPYCDLDNPENDDPDYLPHVPQHVMSLEAVKLRTAATTRDLWMSGAATWLYTWRVMLGKSRSEAAMLAWQACYNPSWHRFWGIMPLVKNGVDYEMECIMKFGNVTGGGDTRFSPRGVGSIDEMLDRNYIKGADRAIVKQEVVDKLLQLLDWVENNGDDCTVDQFRLCLVQIRNELSEILPGMEFAEFRLTLFVQLMGLSGYTKHGSGSGVLDKAYPVKDRGSFKMMVGRCKVPPENMGFAMRLLSDQLGLLTFREAVMENMCCEMNPDRNEVWDFLYRGSALFMLMNAGGGVMRPYIKMYGDTKWVPVSENVRLDRHALSNMGVTDEKFFAECGLPAN